MSAFARAVAFVSLAALAHLTTACEYNPPRRQELRAAICIVGQVGRTELDSKIKNLILANNESLTVDTFLVLEEGEVKFTNMRLGACTAAPQTIQEAADKLQRYGRVFSHPRTYGKYDVQPENWPRYGEELPKRAKRLNNHINQYTSWQQCAKAVEAQEVKDRQLYDVVLRVRDNSLVVRAYNLHKALTQSGYRYGTLLKQSARGGCAPGPRVITKECASWGGLSDKTMLVPRQYLHDALSAPADEFFFRQSQPNNQISGPERYLRRVLEGRRVPVLQVPRPIIMPVTDGRCEDGDSFCIVKPMKDCRPIAVRDWSTCKYTFLRGYRLKYEQKKKLAEETQNAAGAEGAPRSRLRVRSTASITARSQTERS